MVRCKTCAMPNTRPDTPFVDGECSACISYRNRPYINWEGRKRELVQLLDRFNGECIVPSSGGKDSHYQVMKLLELGAHVTVVTATTCHLTPMGRHNIDNLAKYATTIEISPNKTVRAKLNRLGLQLVGDISWPEHVSIFTTPFNVSNELGIPLIFYGENPQNQYGGPDGSEKAKTMTRRWVSEFGGFLGLRPIDLVGMDGITERQMRDYIPSVGGDTMSEAHFLGQYIPWDSHENARIAIDAGMDYHIPCGANWWEFENLDNAQTGIHDYMMFEKYGYGRGCAQISVDVRTGKISREDALRWIDIHDGLYPWGYMGISIHEVLDRIEMKLSEFNEIVRRFSNVSQKNNTNSVVQG